MLPTFRGVLSGCFRLSLFWDRCRATKIANILKVVSVSQRFAAMKIVRQLAMDLKLAQLKGRFHACSHAAVWPP